MRDGSPRRRAVFSVSSGVLDDRKRVVPRVVRPRRIGDGLDLDDGVVRPVHRHVEADIEHVLVDMADDAGPNARSAPGLAALRQAGGVDDAGQLHIQFDGAVEVQVPVEPVFVVADGRDERDHQPPGAPGIGFLGAEIGVFPENAAIFLVQADGVLDHLRGAVDPVDHRIEVVDRAEAVTAELQAVGEHADAVLAAVECVLARMHAGRVTIRHDHLGEARALQDTAATCRRRGFSGRAAPVLRVA